jgi:hypothetical protein
MLLLPKAPETGDLGLQGGDQGMLASQLLVIRNVGPHVLEPDSGGSGTSG